MPAEQQLEQETRRRLEAIGALLPVGPPRELPPTRSADAPLAATASRRRAPWVLLGAAAALFVTVVVATLLVRDDETRVATTSPPPTTQSTAPPDVPAGGVDCPADPDAEDAPLLTGADGHGRWTLSMVPKGDGYDVTVRYPETGNSTAFGVDQSSVAFPAAGGGEYVGELSGDLEDPFSTVTFGALPADAAAVRVVYPDGSTIDSCAAGASLGLPITVWAYFFDVDRLPAHVAAITSSGEVLNSGTVTASEGDGGGSVDAITVMWDPVAASLEP